MTESGIVISDLRRTYGDGEGAVHALQGASLEVARGEIVALSGPSGSGKTTLLNCLVGLDAPTAGTVVALGEVVSALSYEDAVSWRRANVAIVFQATGLLPHLTAAENVDLVLRFRDVPYADRSERVADALDRLGIGDLAQHQPSELSGGQQQRVSLARAIAARPALLVADEPTGQLDSETTAVVLDELRRASADHGMTVVMATHDPDVGTIADRSVHMIDGAIVGDRP